MEKSDSELDLSTERAAVRIADIGHPTAYEPPRLTRIGNLRDVGGGAASPGDPLSQPKA